MNSDNLRRDGLWTPEIWKSIDEAVAAQVGAIRVAQKVLDTIPMTGAANVPKGEIDHAQPKNIRIPEGETKPFIEISAGFSLADAQVFDEAIRRTAYTLAKNAAKSLALAEDTLIFRGPLTAADLPDVNVVNQASADPNLLNAAALRITVSHLPRRPNAYGEHTFMAVTRGISELIKKGRPGPYALFLHSDNFADTYAPLGGTLTTTANLLAPLLIDGGFLGTGTLPEKRGLLVSLGGDPTSIFVGADAITAYMPGDQGGRYNFRVFERVQFMARDPSALVMLEFQ